LFFPVGNGGPALAQIATAKDALPEVLFQAEPGLAARW
jgi:hypothetical protein